MNSDANITLDALTGSLALLESIGPIATHVRCHPWVVALMRRECLTASPRELPTMFGLEIVPDRAMSRYVVEFGIYEPTVKEVHLGHEYGKVWKVIKTVSLLKSVNG